MPAPSLVMPLFTPLMICWNVVVLVTVRFVLAAALVITVPLPVTSLVKTSEPVLEEEKVMSPPILMALATLRVMPSSCRVPPLRMTDPVPSGPLVTPPAVAVVPAPRRMVPEFSVEPPEKSLSGTLMTSRPTPFLVREGVVAPVNDTPITGVPPVVFWLMVI